MVCAVVEGQAPGNKVFRGRQSGTVACVQSLAAKPKPGKGRGRDFNFAYFPAPRPHHVLLGDQGEARERGGR